MRKRGELTPKQKRFAEEYVVDGNAAGAARRAGYSEQASKAIGRQNLQNPRIVELINQIRDSSWPADHVERRPVKDLIPYARNARMHSEEQVGQIAASMREWGWTNPILVDEANGIIAGHGRVLAAQKLGIEEVPVMTAKGWSEAQKRAYVIADNKLAENASWDGDALRLELEGLAEMDFDLPLIGFSDFEISNLLTTEEELERAEETPDVPVNPVTVSGDLWHLGEHRVLCGDATSADDVQNLLAGGLIEPHLMVTDPPYGVEYDANWRNEADRANGRPIGAMATGKVSNDDRADWSEAYSLFPGDVCYVWHAGLKTTVYEDLSECSFEVRAQIIWSKSNFPIGRGHYHVKHEPCWYAVRKGKTAHWAGDRKQSTIWEIAKPSKSETGHSTQKPIECMRKPIINNSKAGDAVYDPFLGSGTTLIAAQMEGRRCYGLEDDPAYVDVIVQRWQTFTGQEAKHENGKTFDELHSERYDPAQDSAESYNDGITAMREAHVSPA